MSPAAVSGLSPADRLGVALLFSLSLLSLAAANALLLASGCLTTRARLRLLPEIAA